MDYYYLGFVSIAAFGILAYFLNKKKNTPVTITTTISPGQEKKRKKSTKQHPSEIKQKQNEKSVQTVRQVQDPIPVHRVKKIEELEKQYAGLFFGSFRLKGDKSIHVITALDFKGSKVLLTTTKNQMMLFNLKSWKKDTTHSTPEKYFVSLDNNGASAVCIGENYYYAALTFDKTIVYYEFKGQSGIYFRQVCKFPRNIYKSNVSAMHASKKQNYIITAGSGNDTVIDIWSMKGEKLANANSFQIQHYNIIFGHKDILIRGWTSEAKIFNVVEQKDGSFKKLQKGQHLTHQQSPLESSIDNRDMYAMSISKNHKVKIWYLYDTVFHKSTQSNQAQHSQIFSNQVSKCGLYTFQPAVGHFKTVVVLAHDKGFYVTDTNLKIINKVQGIQVKDIYLNGTPKSVILGVINNNGQLSLWNLTKQLDKVNQIRI